MGSIKSIKSSHKNDRPSRCAPLEQAIWDELPNRWSGEAATKIPAAAVNRLRAAVGELHGCTLGEDNEATCRMQQTARRAPEMRDLAAADYNDT